MLRLLVKKVKQLDDNVSNCLIVKKKEGFSGTTEMGWMEVCNPVKVNDVIACGKTLKHYKREVVLIKSPLSNNEGDLDCQHSHFNKCVYTGKR